MPTILEMIDAIAEAKVVGSHGKPSTKEELLDWWEHDSDKMTGYSELVGWFETARSATGFYGIRTVVGKTGIDPQLGSPKVDFTEKPSNPVGRGSVFFGVLPMSLAEKTIEVRKRYLVSPLTDSSTSQEDPSGSTDGSL